MKRKETLLTDLPQKMLMFSSTMSPLYVVLQPLPGGISGVTSGCRTRVRSDIVMDTEGVVDHTPFNLAVPMTVSKSTFEILGALVLVSLQGILSVVEGGHCSYARNRSGNGRDWLKETEKKS